MASIGSPRRPSFAPSAMTTTDGRWRARAATILALPPAVVSPLLLSDEPTGNLDNRTGQGIIDLLFGMNAQAGTTLVLVTHDEHLATRCRRQLRLDGGRLVADEATAAQTA